MIEHRQLGARVDAGAWAKHVGEELAHPLGALVNLVKECLELTEAGRHRCLARAGGPRAGSKIFILYTREL